MSIQTDKFGTSVAQSLRVYSETLADQAPSARGGSGGEDRREDGASRWCCAYFPSIWVVTIGPAAIKFVTVLFPMVENMKK